jgi:hypothetical protein
LVKKMKNKIGGKINLLGVPTSFVGTPQFGNE